MHERERWQRIVSTVRERRVVRVRELMDMLNASSATLRRDLVKLEELGQLKRVHGGAEAVQVAEQAMLATRAFDVSQTLNAVRKRALARVAANMCADGESIIINAGSTTWFMAQFLRDRRMQILTNSVPISYELISTSHNRIVLPGGEVYRDQGIILSPFDEDAIQHFTATKMFMSCFAVTSMGIIEGDPLIARAEAKLLTRAEQLVVIADSSKFEQRGSMAVCNLSRVDTLVTDAGASAATLDMLRNAGVKVVVVNDSQEDPVPAAA